MCRHNCKLHAGNAGDVLNLYYSRNYYNIFLRLFAISAP